MLLKIIAHSSSTIPLAYFIYDKFQINFGGVLFCLGFCLFVFFK